RRACAPPARGRASGRARGRRARRPHSRGERRAPDRAPEVAGPPGRLRWRAARRAIRRSSRRLVAGRRAGPIARSAGAHRRRHGRGAAGDGRGTPASGSPWCAAKGGQSRTCVMLAPVADPYVGRDIAGQFRVIEKIGSGGMGAVYKAEQPEMRRFVAIKILHARYLARQDLVTRFKREARAMSHLSHPNTARVFLYGQLDDGACYFVMEYLEGKNLAQTVRRDGPMEPTRAINVMIQTCGALEEAHRGGIVHRDLKPENIFLTSQGGIEAFPKVLDFGLAKVSERQMRPGSLILTQDGMVFGTPEFMSPEQARG